MVLKLTSAHLQTIQAHAERIYAEECCGLLIGKLEHESESNLRLLAEIWEVENTWSSTISITMADLSGDSSSSSALDKSRRYWIDPREMLAGQRYARDRNLDIIGVYHSHPDHPAVPSECDRIYAWPQYSYIIVSVQQGKMSDLRSWNLDQNHQFQPEPIYTISTPSH
ncbi:MAG: M67 family metallopeptidase [Cyanothece sp. SIO1E1]|nr:M67 family metallopeptidase [Cyanothece sp. SIO1E1]